MRSWIALLLLAALCRSSGLAQSNDNFASRLLLTGPSPTAVSNNLHATRESGEPNHAAAGAGRSLWWTWTAPASGTVNFSTSYGGNGVLPIRAIAVYTGDALSSLTEIASTNNLTQSNALNGYYSASSYAAGNSINVPVTAGTVYQIAVDALATSVYLPSDDGTVALTINALPVIVSPASATGTTGASFTYGILATDGATAYAAAGLPSGLSINPTTGQITGTLTAAGTYSIGLSAPGPGGTGSATLTLVVSDPVAASPVVPVFTNSAAIDSPVGTPVSFYLSASGRPTAYTAANLPAGLTINSSTGLVSGTPTTAGNSSVPVTAVGPAGTGTGTLTFNIIAAIPAPIITNALAVNGTTGYAFSTYIATAADGSSNFAPTAYSAGSLPPGVVFNASTGQLSGTPTQAGVYPVPVSATNRGGTRNAVVTITIADPVAAAPGAPAAPALNSTAVTAGIVGTAFSYQLSAANTPTSFGASSLPSGLVLDVQKGVITGTPTTAGTFAVPVSAANSLGTSAGTLTITIAASAAAQSAANGYALPVISSSASASATVGKSFSYYIAAYYQGLPTVTGSGNWTFAATGLPPGLSITTAASSGTGASISGTPTTAGVYPVTISATCPASGSSLSPHPAATGTAVVTLVVSAPVAATPPTIVGAAGVALTVGSASSYFISTSSSSGSSISNYAATGLPPGMSIPSSSSGNISGTPTTVGTYAATISVTDIAGTGTATVTFTVAAPPVPIITSSAAVSGTVGSSFSYTVSASGSPTGVNASNLPPGLTFTTASNTITGTPTTAGTYSVPLTATNASGTANATLTITVAPATSAAPVITSYATAQAYLSQSFSYSISTLTGTVTGYNASNLPPGLSLTSYGYITGTPTATGTYTASISAINAVGTTTATLTITVSNPGIPVISGYAALDATVGQSFGYTLNATNSPTSYTFSGLPAGVSASASTPGYISGTPTTTGTYQVTTTATNATGTATAILTITVVSAPLPAVPVITSAVNATAVAGVPLSYVYSISASNSPTSYAIDKIPAGLAFSTSNGALSGTPAAAGEYVLNISATNAGGTGRGVVNLRVAAGPVNAPIITSASGVVGYVGEPFYYAVTASDSPSSYTASTLPSGLTFNTSSGAMTGTVTAAAGSYPITVTATNSVGTNQATITILVSAIGLPPHFTSSAASAAVVGQSFTKTLTCNVPVTAFSASNLPAGLTLNGATGVISGTPTASGSRYVYLSASTATGTVAGTMYLPVSTSANSLPVITSAAGVGVYYGIPLTYVLSATNSPTTYAASLPTGLSLNPSTGVITGNSDNISSGSGYTISATNSAGTTYGSLTFTLVSPAPASLLQLISGAETQWFVGEPAGVYLTFWPYNSVSTVSASGVPPGVTFDPAAYRFIGTPTATGTYTTTVTAINSSVTAQDRFTFVVTPLNALPTMTSAAGATGSVGSSFSYALSAFNYPTAFTVGNLPAGLSYNASTQSITGIPTVTGTYAIPLTATNNFGQTTATLTLVITPAVTTAPDLSGYNNQTEQVYTAGATASFSIYAYPTPTSYAASGLPPGMTINTSTGTISGTPTTPGTYPVTTTVTNPVGSASAIVTVVVTPATAVAVPGLFLPVESVAYPGVTFTNYLTQSYDNVSAVSADGLPPGLTLNAATGVVSGTPTATGFYRVNVSATNAGGTSTAIWSILVKDGTALMPRFTSGAVETVAYAGQSAGYQATTSVYDGSIYVNASSTYTVGGLPTGLAFSSSSYLSIYGVPTTPGTYPLTITATGPGGGSTTETVMLVVLSPTVPTITTAATLSGNVNVAFSASLTTASGPSISSYRAGTLPDGLTLNTSTGAITGTPTTAGNFTVSVGATGVSGTATAVLTLRIGAALYGGMPLISSPAAIGSQEFPVDTTSYNSNSYPYYQVTTLVSYIITALNKPTAFTAQNLPAGLGFNPYTGLISGQPTTPGVYRVPVSATNSVGTFNTTLTIIVTSPTPTARAALAYNGYVGGNFSTAVSYSFPSFPNYPYGYVFSYYYFLSPIYPTYAASGLPPGLSIDTYNGAISGVALRAGTYPVTVSAIGRGGTGTATMTFFVADTAPASNPAAVAAPVFSSKAEALGFVGLPMNYSLVASRAMSYAATGLPDGLALNPSTGAITGTPATIGTFPITVSASNAGGTVQATLSLTVENAPTAPAVASAAGASANIGVAFTYVLTSTNYAGMPATTGYSVDTLPAGLSLNGATGQISGVPTGPVGTYLVNVTASIGTVASVSSVLTITVLPTPSTLPMPVLTSSAGALAFVDNPFFYAIQNVAFAPSAILPAGLVYDASAGTISGYPTAAGIYLVPLSAPWTNGSTSNVIDAHLKAKGSKISKPARLKTPRGSASVAATGNDGTSVSAVLTIQVTTPDLSLPRLLIQPSGGTVVEGQRFAFAASGVGAPTPVYQWMRDGVTIPAASDSTLVLDPTELADGGIYTLTLSNAAGSVTSNPVMLTVVTTYGSWQAKYFTPLEIAAGLAADTYSFSGDGVANLLKYALGLDPRSNASNLLPNGRWSFADQTLQIQFARDTAKTDIDYLVEVSTDLDTWTVIAQSVAGAPVTEINGGSVISETVILGSSLRNVTVSADQTVNSSTQFLRLQIVRP